jgi:hypothetical protein
MEVPTGGLLSGLVLMALFGEYLWGRRALPIGKGHVLGLPSLCLHGRNRGSLLLLRICV